MESIPTSVCLTTYAGGAEDFVSTPLQEFISEVEAPYMVPRRVRRGVELPLD